MPGQIGFGPFRFDPRSGELTNAETGGSPVRLSPQPAKLLELLARRSPEIVAREEIRAAIWPGVEVEFDASLHFCIRQIRVALGESAADTRYIETLPRRGYRWIAPVDLDSESSPATPASNDSDPREADAMSEAPLSSKRKRTLHLGWISLAALIGLLCLAAWVLRPRTDEPPSAGVSVRIGIMPFRPAGLFTPESLVVDLGNSSAGGPWAVVGPTTTAAYADGNRPLRDTIRDLNLDYVFQIRETQDEPPRRLLELIRADGAHVWVRYLDDLPPNQPVLPLVSAGVQDAIGSR